MNEDLNKKIIKLELTVEQINTCMAALAKQPYEIAEPIIRAIHTQATPQLQIEEEGLEDA